MLDSMDIEVIAIHGNPIAAHPVSIPLPSCITVLDEHPFLSVNGEDGASAKLAKVSWMVDVEVRQVVVARECDVALILVAENSAEAILGVLNGVLFLFLGTVVPGI